MITDMMVASLGFIIQLEADDGEGVKIPCLLTIGKEIGRNKDPREPKEYQTSTS